MKHIMKAKSAKKASKGHGRAARLGGPEGRSLQERAAEAAAGAPTVEVEPAEVPELSGNLVRDVRTVCGLTARELGGLFGRTERAAQQWRRSGPPEDVRPQLEAMQAIGLTLVGGLGARGVRRWLTSGRPSPLDRIRAGRVAEVAAQVRAYEDSVAT